MTKYGDHSKIIVSICDEVISFHLNTVSQLIKTREHLSKKKEETTIIGSICSGFKNSRQEVPQSLSKRRGRAWIRISKYD